MSRANVLLSLLVLVFVNLAVPVASAHVTVEPREVAAGAFQAFVVRVPTEKAVPTIKVRVEFPPEVVVSRFEPKAGWKREVEKDSTGKLTAIVWSGGQIGTDEYEDFSFIARSPRQPGTITWKAEQTYQDGETVSWTGPEGSDAPASITTVREATTVAQGSTIETHGQPPAGAAAVAPVAAASPVARPGEPGAIATGTSTAAGSDLPLFVGIAALVVALVALAIAGLGFARRPRPV